MKYSNCILNEIPGFPAHQGKLLYFFPVREKSGNLKKCLKSGKSQGILIALKIKSSQSVIFCCISKQHIHWMTGYGGF